MFASADYLGILQSIILLVPVDVMNNCIGGLFSAEMLFHNIPVFKHLIAVETRIGEDSSLLKCLSSSHGRKARGARS